MEDLYESDIPYFRGRNLFLCFLIATPILCALPYWVFDFHRQQHFILEDLNRDRTGPLSRTLQEIPPPRLQIQPRLDIEQLREQQLQELTSYGWVDRQSGLVRIPIDEAMKRYAQTLTQP